MSYVLGYIAYIIIGAIIEIVMSGFWNELIDEGDTNVIYYRVLTVFVIWPLIVIVFIAGITYGILKILVNRWKG